MKKLVAVILLTLTTLIGAQAQTTNKRPKPGAPPTKVAVVPPAVSDAFLKIASHVLLAVRNSNGSDVAAGHIETLFEDLEIEATTPTEKLLSKRFALIDVLNRLHLQYHDQTALRRDGVCLNNYLDMLKINDSKTDFNAVPFECDSTVAGIK
jgi:hypothetical protein